MGIEVVIVYRHRGLGIVRILLLGGVLCGDCCCAARPFELYVGLEVEWTIGVWFKGIVRLLNLSA